MEQMTLKDKQAEYGMLCLQLESLQNRAMQLKREIVEELQQPKPTTDPNPSTPGAGEPK